MSLLLLFNQAAGAVENVGAKPAGHSSGRRTAVEYRKKIHYFEDEEKANKWLQSIIPVVASPSPPKLNKPAVVMMESAFRAEPVRYVSASPAFKAAIRERNRAFIAPTAQELDAIIKAHTAMSEALRKMREDDQDALDIFMMLELHG